MNTKQSLLAFSLLFPSLLLSGCGHEEPSEKELHNLTKGYLNGYLTLLHQMHQSSLKHLNITTLKKKSCKDTSHKGGAVRYKCDLAVEFTITDKASGRAWDFKRDRVVITAARLEDGFLYKKSIAGIMPVELDKKK